MDIKEFEISKLSIKAGDIFIVRIRRNLMPHSVYKKYADEMKTNMQSILPEGVKIMIVNEEIDLAILSSEERLFSVQLAS